MKKILVILLVCLAGCYNQKKAQRNFSRAAINYPEIPAQYCSNAFPVKEIIREGKDSITTDTLWVQGETVRDTIKKDSVIYITTTIQLPGKVITNNFYKTDTIVKENTAKLEACEIERRKVIALLETQTNKADKWQAIAKKRFWIIAGLSALLIFGLISTIKSKVYAAK